MKKYNAFTLAETLITLMVIGIVSALVIPSVNRVHKRHVFYTQFISTYEALSKALDMAVINGGSPTRWGISEIDTMKGTGYNINDKIVQTKIAPYLKIKKYCKARSYCDNIPNDTKIYKPDGTPWTSYNGNFTYKTKYMLESGAFVGIYAFDAEVGPYRPVMLNVEIDTNGPFKGPNMLGRDIFTSLYFMPSGADKKYRLTSYSLIKSLENPIAKTPQEIERRIASCKSGCAPTDAFSCSARLLYRHKMDY